MQILWVSIDASALAENSPGPGPSNLSGVGGWEIGLGREDNDGRTPQLHSSLTLFLNVRQADHLEISLNYLQQKIFENM